MLAQKENEAIVMHSKMVFVSQLFVITTVKQHVHKAFY